MSTPVLSSPPPPLRGNEVHVWLVRLEHIAVALPDWDGFLSSDERAKAERFVRADDRHRSAASRAVLRRLLGHHYALAPSAVRFTANAFGKPAVDRRLHPEPLRFSVSHSGNLALIGLSGRAPIGVDIEGAQRHAALDEIAATICTTGELHRLGELPPARRSAELLRTWTLKEAYVKALGVGLSLPPQRVAVLGPTGFGAPPFLDYTLQVPGAWTTLVLGELPGYEAAVAVAAAPVTPVLRWFDSFRW